MNPQTVAVFDHSATETACVEFLFVSHPPNSFITMAFKCGMCRFSSPKWMGFCPQCRGSEPLIDASSANLAVPVGVSDSSKPASRISTGLEEVDRVLGGGLVRGSAVLVGGEPGIGKSTLLGQVGARMTSMGSRVLLASAEESVDQVGLRQRRLGIPGGDVDVIASSDINSVLEVAPGYDVLIIDSIQTVFDRESSGGPGSVSQVRSCADRAVRLAKERGVTLILVGHITKEGSLAGPKALEHLVDVVLYFEPDDKLDLRVLRGMKNRFGTVWATGVFEMTANGLIEIPDPSVLALDGRSFFAPGSVIMPALAGRRCLLNEVQALVVPTNTNAPPRRSSTGVTSGRLHQILAVLDRRAGLSLATAEVYVSVMGGVQTVDPATDLAIAAAIVSSRLDVAIPRVAAFGELGLTGEIRASLLADVRVAECHRLSIDSVLAAPLVTRVDQLVSAIRELGDEDADNSEKTADVVHNFASRPRVASVNGSSSSGIVS